MQNMQRSSLAHRLFAAQKWHVNAYCVNWIECDGTIRMLHAAAAATGYVGTWKKHVTNLLFAPNIQLKLIRRYFLYISFRMPICTHFSQLWFHFVVVTYTHMTSWHVCDWLLDFESWKSKIDQSKWNEWDRKGWENIKTKRHQQLFRIKFCTFPLDLSSLGTRCQELLYFSRFSFFFFVVVSFIPEKCTKHEQRTRHSNKFQIKW